MGEREALIATGAGISSFKLGLTLYLSSYTWSQGLLNCIPPRFISGLVTISRLDSLCLLVAVVLPPTIM